MTVERRESPNFERELSSINAAYREKMLKTNARYELELTKFPDGSRQYLRAAGPRKLLEIELAYLANEISAGPGYIKPKHVLTANQLIEKFGS